MAQQFQTKTRAPHASRFNRPGPKLLTLLQAFRPTGTWDPSKFVSLNGADVSSVADVSGARRWAGSARALAQSSGAQQPLGTGAPVYNIAPSIQFTAASNDCLTAANANLVGIGPYVMFSIQRMRSSGASPQSPYSNTDGGGSAGVIVQVAGTGNVNRLVTKAGAGSQFGGADLGAASTALAEVWCIRMAPGAEPYFFLNAGAPISGTINPGLNDPGAAATFSWNNVIGVQATDQDGIFLSAFQHLLSDNILYRIAHTAGLYAGVSVA